MVVFVSWGRLLFISCGSAIIALPHFPSPHFIPEAGAFVIASRSKKTELVNSNFFIKILREVDKNDCSRV